MCSWHLIKDDQLNLQKTKGLVVSFVLYESLEADIK